MIPPETLGQQFRRASNDAQGIPDLVAHPRHHPSQSGQPFGMVELFLQAPLFFRPSVQDPLGPAHDEKQAYEQEGHHRNEYRDA